MAIPFQLLHAGFEHFAAFVAFCSELLVVTVVTEKILVAGSEKLVYEGIAAFGALEAPLVPMFILVRQVLGISSDLLHTRLAVVCVFRLIAIDAV